MRLLGQELDIKTALIEIGRYTGEAL